VVINGPFPCLLALKSLQDQQSILSRSAKTGRTYLPH